MRIRTPLGVAITLAALQTPLQARLPILRTDAQIIDFTDRVIRLNGLSSNVGCLQYSADESGRGRIYVKVFELHDTKCGGDPDTQPLLYTIRYDLKTNGAATDKGSINGVFHPIRLPAN